MYYFWFGPLLSPQGRQLYKMFCDLMFVPLLIIVTAEYAAYPQVDIFGNNWFKLSVLIWLISCIWFDKFLLRHIVENDEKTLLADWKWEPAQRDWNTVKSVYVSLLATVMLANIYGRIFANSIFFITFLGFIFVLFFLYFAHMLQAIRKDGFINKNKFYPWHSIDRYSWKQIDGIDFLVLYLEKTDNMRPVSREEFVFKIPIDKMDEVRAILSGKIEVAPQTETGGAFSHAARNGSH